MHIKITGAKFKQLQGDLFTKANLSLFAALPLYPALSL